MEGYRINPNIEHVKLIIDGLEKGSGFCPCKVQKTEENLKKLDLNEGEVAVSTLSGEGIDKNRAEQALYRSIARLELYKDK